MLDFFRYFFGMGEHEEFANFTLAHFMPILLAAGVIFCIYHFRSGIRSMKNEIYLRYTLAFILIVSEMSYYWRLIAIPALQPNPIDHLPITVCGWVAVLASYMVIGKSQTLFDLSYFWTFAGSTFALLTPTVITYTGPTRFRYYQFWAEHLFSYIAIFYMIFVHNMRPNKRSFVRAYIGIAILAAIAYFANRLLGPGANYLFMARPEDTPSILDFLPSNFALRLFVMVSAITVLFVLSYIPWYIKDKKVKKAAQHCQ